MGIYTFYNGIRKTLENAAKAQNGIFPGLATHFNDLDKITGGFRGGRFDSFGGEAVNGKNGVSPEHSAVRW